MCLAPMTLGRADAPGRFLAIVIEATWKGMVGYRSTVGQFARTDNFLAYWAG